MQRQAFKRKSEFRATGVARHFLFLSLLFFIFIPAITGCERFSKIPVPDGIPESAIYDRVSGLWTVQDQNGDLRRYYSSGRIAEMGQYEQGSREGIWKTFTEDGVIASEGLYLNDWRDGTWKFHDGTGQVYLTVEYRPQPRRGFGFLVTHDYGNENGPYYRYFPSGRLEEKGIYVGGYYEGPVVRYFKDGTVAMEGQFSKDQKTGVWKYYYPSGKLEKVVPYKKDRIEGEMIVYLPDGRVYQKTVFSGDQKESVQIFRTQSM